MVGENYENFVQESHICTKHIYDFHILLNINEIFKNFLTLFIIDKNQTQPGKNKHNKNYLATDTSVFIRFECV